MIYLKRASAIFIIFAGVLVVAAIIILFARGYRPNFAKFGLSSEGILVTNSAPNNAQVYINGVLKGLTPNNWYLKPGKYEVVIKKEGYNSWKKTFTIKGEVVSRTDSQLFSNNPSLSPLTNRGVIAPYFSPSKEKIVYLVLPSDIEVTDNNLEEGGGLFIASISSQTLSLFKSRLLLMPYNTFSTESDLAKTQYIFSPNEKNLLVFFKDKNNNLLNVKLISATNRTDVFDVTLAYEGLLQKWNLEQTNLQTKIIETFPKKIRQFLSKNTYIIDLSPDKTKIFYLALTNKAVLPRIINPPLIGSVPTTEQREIQSGEYYVYCAKEDKNFRLDLFDNEQKEKILSQVLALKAVTEPDFENILAKQQLFGNMSWYDDSRHLIYDKDSTIYTIEYDGQNPVVVYSGPFEKAFNGVTEDGKLIILTNINPKKNLLSDLYTVSIK